jgi:hypothetical protein
LLDQFVVGQFLPRRENRGNDPQCHFPQGGVSSRYCKGGAADFIQVERLVAVYPRMNIDDQQSLRRLSSIQMARELADGSDCGFMNSDILVLQTQNEDNVLVIHANQLHFDCLGAYGKAGEDATH